MEAPYLVTDTNRRGWGVACSCGYRSPLFEEREDALMAAKDHLEIDAVQTPETGWRARRRAKKQKRSEWDERRRRPSSG